MVQEVGLGQMALPLGILAMVHIWRKKFGIWNVCKFSLYIFGCTVARRDIKFKTNLQNFLYLENKESNICHLNLDLET